MAFGVGHALQPEAPLGTTPPGNEPPSDWPQRGEIVLEDVSLCYSEDMHTILKSFSHHHACGEGVK